MELHDLIVQTADRFKVPRGLALAVCEQESSFDPWAWNPEPKYRYLWDLLMQKPFRKLTSAEIASEFPPMDFRAPRGVPTDAEWWGQQASWGLCLAEGTPVATSEGWVPIEKVAVDTSVVDRNGALSTVAAVSSRKAECLDVRVGLNPSLRLTADHLIFARKSMLGFHGTGRRKIVTEIHPDWIPVSGLSEWDMLAMPRTTPVRDVESMRLTDTLCREPRWKDATEYVEDGSDLVMRYRSGGRIRARVRNEIVVDDRLMELAGLYLAEGHALDKHKGAAFSFHENETDLHARVLSLFKSIFGVDPNYYIHRNRDNHCVQICVYGPAARWLTLILPGTALTKAIPGWMLWLPPEKQAALVRGMWLGDGCFGFGHYTTASRSLAYGMAHLLARIGIVARLTPTRTWFSVGLNSHDSVVRFRSATRLPVVWPQTATGRQRITAVSWRSDADFVYFPVRGVGNAGTRQVHDLQVPPDASFVAGRTVAHNCQVMGAVARERGFMGKFLSQLCDPPEGLKYGCIHLAAYLKRFKEPFPALEAFNGGPGAVGKNEKYANEVLARLEHFKA